MPKSFLLETFAQEEAEERQSMVELHLLVAEGGHKQYGAHIVPVLHDEPHGRQEEPETDVVVLKVSVVDEDEAWVGQQGHRGPQTAGAGGAQHEDGGEEDEKVCS